MAPSAKQMVILACMAAGTASLDGGCNCEAACAEVVERQRKEIAHLQAEVRALRGSSEDVTAVRRTATVEQSGPCNSSWELNSDAEVESLANKSCPAVHNISIGGSVTSLIGLESLETAEKVVVSHANFLKSLTGLESLQSVGSFLLHGNRRLKSLTELENLQSVGTVSISNNPRLSSLAGLENLTSASSLVLGYNHKLESLEGLANLRSVTTLEVSYNDALQSLAGLENLDSVTTLEISSNQGLQSLAGLENLDNVTTLEISGNYGLESLAGLENLGSVTTLRISFNWNLGSLAGLENLGSVTTLKIDFNYRLESLAGLENLSSVASLLISDNNRLESLAGLANLRSVTTLEVSYNDALQSLAGLENLDNVTSLEISGNYGLESLAGLENLRSVTTLRISRSWGLGSLAGLENLGSVTTLEISDNYGLESLAGLENLGSVATLQISSNNRLESLAGLENLSSVATLQISSNDRLESLAGLENLDSVTALRISFNDRLDTLSGLETLRSVTTLEISNNFGLESLAGLESLRHVSTLKIRSNRDLKSLSGLENLRFVFSSLLIANNWDLSSLLGLRSLQAAGSVSLEYLPRLTSLAGLDSLAYAFGGITILSCDGLTSLHGLGSLYRAGQLSVQGSVQMKALGGPFATGAEVGTMHIDKAVWPRCVTPHEHTALVSAVAHTEFAFVPNSTWQQWRDNSCGSEMVTCTKGYPCNLSLVDFGGERVFISEPTQGCGTCSDAQLQANVSIGGAVDLGYLLKGEEGGHRSICRCGPEVGPVTQLFLRAPARSGVAVCRRGRNCTFKVNGGVEATDHVTLMSSCSQGNPLLGSKASWAAENLYLLHVPAAWYAAAPFQYQVCWRAPCSSTADGPVCPSPEGGYFHVGEVELIGPSSTHHTLVLGEQLLVPNVGFGVSDGDWMRLRRACGEASEEDRLDTRGVKSSGMVFDFGRLTEDHAQAGNLRLCWCQEEQDGAQCKAEGDFTVDSGAVQIVCPAGQELVSSGRCEQCPAGKQRLEPGLEACLKCPAGLFSPGGNQRCEACPEGAVAELMGSSACAVCQSWESASAEAARCSTDPKKVIVLMLLFFSVGAFSSMLAWVIRRRLPVVDVSLDQGRAIITTLGCHGLSNFGSHSFPVTLRDTGHAGLDSPSDPLRVRVKDGARLELLTCGGKSIESCTETSRGTLAVVFPHNLYHRGGRVPAALSLPLLFITAVIFFLVAVTEDMAAEAVVVTVAAALICTVASAALGLWPRATPLTRRLSEFELRLQEQPHGSGESCEKGPARGISIGKLHELLEFFHDFIRGRNTFFLDSNILYPLSKASGLSYAELVGAGQAEWFVSHCWATAFEHLCAALRKHAEAVCGQRDWTTLHYWISFCSSNQFQSKEGLSANWKESPVHLTLQSGDCRGTCMVLDDQALPLTRIWCVYELLQTLKLERNDQSFQGLFLCTSGGVMNMGSGSVEAVMALAKQVAEMDLASARATSTVAEEVLRAQILQEVGSPSVVSQFVRREVQGILVRAQENSYQHFAAALAHLQLEGAFVHV